MQALAASQETDTLHAIPRRQRELREAEEEAEKDEDLKALEKAGEHKAKFEENLEKLRAAWDRLAAFSSDQKDEIKKLEKEIQALRRRMDLKGVTLNRRGVLEVTRAISLTPFEGDITFNAKSGEKTSTSLYGTEVHATRYQYGFALTPEGLHDKSRALNVVDAVTSLSEVAGNQSRFLYDFSPDSVIFRWTDDFAPRILYGFQLNDGQVNFPEIVRRVEAKDIEPSELILGGAIADHPDCQKLMGASINRGVKSAADEVKRRIKQSLKLA